MDLSLWQQRFGWDLRAAFSEHHMVQCAAHCICMQIPTPEVNGAKIDSSYTGNKQMVCQSAGQTCLESRCVWWVSCSALIARSIWHFGLGSGLEYNFCPALLETYSSKILELASRDTMWWECFTPLLAPWEQVVSQFRVSQRGSSRLVFLLLMMMAIQGLEEEEPFNFLAPSALSFCSRRSLPSSWLVYRVGKIDSFGRSHHMLRRLIRGLESDARGIFSGNAGQKKENCFREKFIVSRGNVCCPLGDLWGLGWSILPSNFKTISLVQ